MAVEIRVWIQPTASKVFILRRQLLNPLGDAQQLVLRRVKIEDLQQVTDEPNAGIHPFIRAVAISK